MSRFLSTLGNELRALNATMIISMESAHILGSSMSLPTNDLSSLLEGLIVLRYTELEGRLRRLVSITKMRDSAFDPCLRQFEITPHGIEIGEAFRGVEALMSGFAREPGKEKDRQ